jgi:hypothetical protein
MENLTMLKHICSMVTPTMVTRSAVVSMTVNENGGETEKLNLIRGGGLLWDFIQ